MTRSREQWIRGIAVILGFLCASAARAQSTPDSQGRQILAVVQPVGSFRLAESDRHAFELDLVDDRGRALGSLWLLREEDRPHRFHSRSFAMEIWNYVPDDRVVTTLVHAASAVAARDDGSWATGALRSVRPPPTVPTHEGDATIALVAIALLLALWRGPRVSWTIRLPHLLPAAIQAALFVYWSVYWPAVRGHVPSMLLELVMAFAADAAFSFARFGSWRIGAAPLPVVLSANLFAWFTTPGIVITVLVAFGSKALIRRDGRHVLNPSAAGLTIAGVIATFAPTLVNFGGVFHTMNAAPNFAELIVVLAIVPQLRFRIVPVSIGAALALWFFFNPTVLRPAVLLAIVLFTTDPATIPQTDLGKLAFGTFFGFGFTFCSFMLRRAGVPDDFAKVIPIPFANALVPQFDALGRALVARLAWIDARWRDLPSRPPIPNAALVGCWLLLIVPAFWLGKAATFEPALHWTWGTPYVARDADDVPRCRSNPLFCRPFSFATEVEAWREK